MKKMSIKEIVLGKKIICAGCAMVCLLLMFFNVFDLSSVTKLGNNSISDGDSFSLINFLFNKDCLVYDTTVKYLREMFAYSHVVSWVTFTLILAAIGVTMVGIFSKKALISKIGSLILLVGSLALITVSFDVYELSSITNRYLAIFTFPYILSLMLSLVGVYMSFSIKE